MAYLDTYLLQNGIGYNNSSHDWKGHWGVYPFLLSGCIVASDITQGMYTFKLDIPASMPNGFDDVINCINSDFEVTAANKGLVLRSESGYCFRIIINNTGNIATQRINCHVYNQTDVKVLHSDLAFSSQNLGLLLKDPNANCFRTSVDVNGNLFAQSITCGTSVKSHVGNGDVFIESATKGLILKNNRGFCYRITVGDNGVLHSALLTACPQP